MNERYEGREEERSRGWGSRDRGRGFYPGEVGSQHSRERSGEAEWGRNPYGGDYDQGWRGQSGQYGQQGQYGQYGQYGESGEFSDAGRFGREYGRGAGGDYGRGGGDYERGDWGRGAEAGRYAEREGRTPYYGAMGYRDYGGVERGSTLYGGRYGGYEGTSGRDRQSFGARQQGAQYGGEYGRSAYGYGEGRGRSEFGQGAYGTQGEHGRGFFSRLFGRGPKGYTRSDERIKEDISERLWNADQIDSSEVTVEVKDSIVILSGTVPERWMRHEIENVADACPGVKDVDNNIRIDRQQLGGRQQGSQQQQQGSPQPPSGTETRGTSGSTSRSRPS